MNSGAFKRFEAGIWSKGRVAGRAWIEPQVGAVLSTPRADGIPLYLVFGGNPDVFVGACGRNSVATIAGRPAGVGVVRSDPLCWPTGGRLRTETQIAAHEIVETVDRALGHGTCAGGGTCRGRAICEGSCDLVDLGIRLHSEPAALDSFTSLAHQIQRIQGSLRQVLVSLSPQPLEDGSLVESLAVLVGELERRSGLECRFVHRHITDGLSPAISLALFRIAQEGLTNALRHARARRLELRLERRGDEITLAVHDDGHGIDPAEIGRGFGTRGIQARASALGGRATWTVDRGTHLLVGLPLRDPCSASSSPTTTRSYARWRSPANSSRGSTRSSTANSSTTTGSTARRR